MAGPFSELIIAAREARESAWCPYSGFAVGAAVQLADGRSFAACNVENSSFGLSICAERAAVFTAVAAGMRAGELEAVAVFADGPGVVTPCGACRQVIAEFAAAGCRVICVDSAGVEVHYSAAELLPAEFRLKD